MTNHNTQHTSKGFALLITIITLTVIISVTLAIVELSLKQLELSVNSKDSELAFHAANAALECARFTRKVETAAFEGGLPVDFTCLNQTDVNVAKTLSVSGTEGDIYTYHSELNWITGTVNHCSEMTILVMNVKDDQGDLVYGSMQTQIPGYATASKKCDQGGRCTVVSVSGYSSSCAEKTAVGTLKRELLVEF